MLPKTFEDQALLIKKARARKTDPVISFADALRKLAKAAQ